MATFSNKILPKFCSKFHCENCDYITSKKSSYDDHLLSRKHLAAINGNQILPKFCSEFICQNCSKKYVTNSGLWRHKQKCITGENIKTEENIKIDDKQTDIIMMLIKENNDFKTMMMKVLENGTHNNNNNTISQTNSHNKAFNLQFFLNETCKDAMNIMDFVESIKLQLSDFENVGDVGFVNGISNIIIKNLKALDITQRPVHCTDQKRETIYIKDENKWEKEDDKKQKFHKFIKKVVSKNQRLILKFQEVYPDYNKYSSPNSTRYDKIIIEALGGKGDNDIEKEDKIISNISKVIGVDKDTV